MKTTPSSLLVVTSASLLLLATGCGHAAPAAPPQTAGAAAPTASAPPPAPTRTEATSPTGPAPSTGDIRTAVSAISADIQQCYLAGTFKDSELAGTVQVSFTIETTGRVSSAVDSGSDLADPEVVDCVIDLFVGLSFRPGGQNPTEVTYPIRFASRG
jgi:hypothetical protein